MDISLLIFLALIVPFIIFTVVNEVKELIDYYFDKKLEYEQRRKVLDLEEEA